MLRYAALFLVVAIIAATFAFGGVVSMITGVATGVFFLFLLLFMGSLILGLSTPLEK